MKRYYTSFFWYRVIMIFLPVMFTFNGIMFILKPNSNEDIFYYLDMFLGYFMLIMAVFMLIHVYRIYKKKIYFEINESSMIYSFGRRKIVYEFEEV